MKKFSFFHKIQGKNWSRSHNGRFHEGHLSLVQPLLEQVEIKVASFARQFNDKDDLKKYPAIWTMI